MSQRIGRLATNALIAEASLSPKPGLVTPVSSGAHRDMDYRLFVVSAKALAPCFEACAFAGKAAARSGASPGALLGTLRAIGRQGEQAMFRVTGGINTHKGAIFCLGLLSAGMAFALARGLEADRLGDAACGIAAELCVGLVERELSGINALERLTAGERLYLEQGIRGARGQAEDGYPLLRGSMLPLLRKSYSQGGERYTLACLDALLLAMSELEDSCLLARGGPSGLTVARQGALEVLHLGGANSKQGSRALIELDGALSHAGLSPGGSADLVAAGIFLVTAENRLTATRTRRPREWSYRRIA